MKIVSTLLILSLLFIFTACNSSADDEEIQFSTSFKQLDIPLRSHGYGNFETTVIDTNKMLEEFLTTAEQDYVWSEREEFSNIIKNATIDFTIQNLVLYRITEGSGSIVLTPQDPTRDGNKLLVTVKRDVPEVGTDDMSYNCLAYAVDKNITSIIFHVGDKDFSISNTPQDKLTACTMEYAPVCASKEVQCITAPCNPVAQTYSNSCMATANEAIYLFDGECPSDVEVPKDCVSWYDGCNNCSKMENGLIVCTEMYCQLPNSQFECLNFN